MVYIVTAFIILCVIIALAYLVKPSTPTKQPTKAPVKRKIFQKRDYFFRSAKERSLYVKLLSIADKTQYAVFPGAVSRFGTHTLQGGGIRPSVPKNPALSCRFCYMPQAGVQNMPGDRT